MTSLCITQAVICVTPRSAAGSTSATFTSKTSKERAPFARKEEFADEVLSSLGANRARPAEIFSQPRSDDGVDDFSSRAAPGAWLCLRRQNQKRARCIC